jgi:hypothetical protein
VPESLLRSKRAVAVAVVATVVGVSAAVLLSGQTTAARAATAPGSTVRASVADSDADSNGSGGENQELSANGTTVVFSSYERLDRLSNAENEAVYIRDLRNDRTIMISRGQFTRPEPPSSSSQQPLPTPTTTTTEPTFEQPKLAGKPLLSLNGRKQEAPEYGETAPTGGSTDPTISADGRFVAFVTRADNIVVADDDEARDLVLCDRDPDGDGEFDEQKPDGDLDYRYYRVNTPRWDDAAQRRGDDPQVPKLSDSGNRIVWQDRPVAGTIPGYAVVLTAPITPAGPGAIETLAPALGDWAPRNLTEPDVSADGRFVVMVGDYWDPGNDGGLFHAIIRKDLLTHSVARVDWDEDTTPGKPVPISRDESIHLAAPAISGDGGTIAFEAEEYENHCSSEQCWYPTAHQPVVYVVRAQENGTAIDSVIASRDNENVPANAVTPSLSGDGRFVAFVTDNANTHDGVDIPLGESDSCISYEGDIGLRMPPVTEDRDNRFVCQVVVRDLVVDRQRVADDQPRLPGTLGSPGLSRDCAESLPDDATCGGNDDSTPYDSTAPSLSANGSTVAYDSWASDLVEPRDDNPDTDVYVRTFRPELRADPTPLEFGEVTLEETLDRVVRLDHVGFGPLVVSELAIDDSPEFTIGAQTCTGPEVVVLQQTGNCEVSIRFTPAAEGARTGTLVVRLRDGREFTVPLRGTGIKAEEPPEPEDGRFSAGPDPLAFGDRLLMSKAPAKAVTVTNTGGKDLTVTGVAVVSPLAPGDYTIDSDTCTDTPVPPGGTCQVAVLFSPLASGARAAVLRFTDDVPGDTPHLIGLTGTAPKPAIEVSPGVSQPGRVLTVTGTGYAPGKPVTIRLTGLVEKATAKPNDTGVFTATLLIMPKTSIGTYPVVATIDDTEPPISAAKPVLIVAPSVSPADFVIRN